MKFDSHKAADPMRLVAQMCGADRLACGSVVLRVIGANALSTLVQSGGQPHVEPNIEWWEATAPLTP